MVSAVAFGLRLLRAAPSSGGRSPRPNAPYALRRRAAEQALQAVSDERARIARELHDIVAHSVSVMVVQAGAAEKALTTTRTTCAKALGSIRTTGTSALAEMRRVVALIRDDGETAGLHPQPDLADRRDNWSPRWTSRRRCASRARSNRSRPGVALSTFRIVQEALTNVRRHAQAGSVAVTLRYLPDSLEIEVADDGVGTAVASGRQRPDRDARARRRCTAGPWPRKPRPGQGFLVRAVLPMAGSADDPRGRGRRPGAGAHRLRDDPGEGRPRRGRPGCRW